MKFKKVFLIYIISFIMIFELISQSYVYADNIPNIPDQQSIAPLEIPTPCAILIDAKSGQILYDKNSHTKMYPASITKIMTALLALEKGNLQSRITMSRNAVYSIEPDSSNAGLMEGEELTLEQLLYALLLNSANEAANAIGENIGGSTEEFAKMMTQRAKELGALNTNFANPNGLHNPEHYTTPYDMAMIAKHAMTIPKFREIVSTYTYTLPPTNKYPKEKELFNSNKLIASNSKYYYPNAIGVKTGYTIAAGSTLVSAAKKGDVELIAVVMNSPIESINSYMYIDSVKMFNYGFENFETKSLIKKGEAVEAIKVKASKASINAIAENDINYLLPKNFDLNTLKVTKQINDLYSPIKKGDIIGSITYEKDGNLIGKVNLLADSDAKKSTFAFLGIPKEKTFSTILWLIVKWILFILISLFVGLILLLIIYNKIRKRLRKKRKKIVKLDR